MSDLGLYDGAREARQVDNFFWHLERYFEALDINDEEEKFYPESAEDMAMINLRRLRQKGSIQEYVKEYLALMLEILEMFARLEDFKQRERPRSPRHERAKDGGDGRSKSGLPKTTDDEWSEDEGRHRHHKGEKKHERSRKQGDAITRGRRSMREVASRLTLVTARLMGCLEEDASTVQMVNAFVQKSKEEAAKGKVSKKRRGLLYVTVDVAGKTQEVFVDIGAIHNFMSPRVAEWLGLKPTTDGSWFTAMNAEERPTKGVVKNVDLRIGGWTGKADFKIIDMDKLGVVLGMDFMEKSSATLNPYCEVMAGKEG
ncbi:hypothetical protein RJ639_042703 [Escallonia herrerae]|uniref:Retrotransposon gag domain-containing protein n=1 Tax=Escallonia herrerae TaxID=1293975 RepID=A0AA89AZJ8_9ASTE|nr:hypothetical protein RJ639_042703 [Escallonia herrerae]